MGFNLDFEVKDNLTKSQKKQLRDSFLKDGKKDLSSLRGFYLVNPFDDTTSYKSTQAHSSTSLSIDGK